MSLPPSSPSSSHLDLDTLMADIQRDPVEPVEPPARPGSGVQPFPLSSATLQLDTTTGQATAHPDTTVAPTNPLANQMWGSNLTPHQRKLPKIPYQMLGGIVAMVIFTLGLGSATFLAGQNQDTRNQAYVDTLPDVQGPLATETQEQYEARLAAQGEVVSAPAPTTRFSPAVLMSGTLLGVGAFLVIVFLVWFFVV